MVNRVKEWLTPSSWLSTWSKGSNDVAVPPHIPNNVDQGLGPPGGTLASATPSISSSLFVPKPGPLTNPFLSNPMALLGSPRNEAGPSGILGDVPSCLTGADVVGSRDTNQHSVLNKSHADSSMETRLRSLVSVPLSLRSSGGVPSGPVTMGTTREDMDTSKDSESSWVAEDDGSTEEEGQQRDRDQRLGKQRVRSFPPSLNLSDVEKSDEYVYELGEGSAGVVQPESILTPVTTGAEQDILQVENPAATCTSPPTTTKTLSTTRTTPSMDNGRTLLSSSILDRLYTTNPFAISTPQLSPVHETREETVS